MRPQEIARVAYDANRAYALSLGEQTSVWEHADPADRMMWLTAIAFQMATPGLAEEDAHNQWLLLEALAGWRYGLVLDNANKRHPHHVPWDKLPEPQRVKIRLNLAIVRTLAAAAEPEDRR